MALGDIMELVEFSRDNLKKYLSENKLVLVDFFTSNCGLCDIGLLILKQVALNYEKQLVVGKLNIDDAREYQINLGINTTPMMVLFKDGYPVIKISGMRTVHHIKDKINQYKN